MSGSLDHDVVVTHERKGDKQISIKVNIMNACSVCKGKMCDVPRFLRGYYMVGYYYVTDYTYEEPNKVTAAPARKRKHLYLPTPCSLDQIID